MAVVALTGGVAVGKTAMMTYWLSRYDIPIFDTDDIGRSVLEEKQIRREVEVIFGPDALTDTGFVDRVYVQKRIFSDPHERSALESLLHPHIRSRSEAMIEAHLIHHPYCVVVVPLLFETNTASRYDRVCVVESALDQRVRRCFDRGLSEDVTMAIIQSQATSEERLSIADDVLYNMQDFTFFYRQIDALFESYAKIFSK